MEQSVVCMEIWEKSKVNLPHVPNVGCDLIVQYHMEPVQCTY